jgi:hypothetical protein
VVSVSPPGRFDQPDDRHAELGCDFLRHFGFAFDGGIGRTATEGEIVSGDDHRSAVDGAAAEHAVPRHEGNDVALGIVACFTRDAADLLETAGIEHQVYALAYGEPSAGVLAVDTVFATHFARERLTKAQFGKFGFPASRGLRFLADRSDKRVGHIVVGHALPIRFFRLPGRA